MPPLKDHRTRFVPIGCGICIECRKQKSREWLVRLQEEIKYDNRGKFITLTYSTESLKKLAGLQDVKYTLQKRTTIRHAEPPAIQKKPKPRRFDKDMKKLKGYDLDNAIVIKSIRLFLERWRKKYKKSLKHWLITELGDGRTEHIHLHGIIWPDDIKDIDGIWQYGIVWKGYEKNGKLENYVNEKTVNYMTKYVTKIDPLHLNYKPMILTSPGIGATYTRYGEARKNQYNEHNTNETYKTGTGYKIALPIYWRNKIYTEEQREKLWIQKLDKDERWVCGEHIKNTSTEKGKQLYEHLREYHQKRTEKLGYYKPDFIWSKKKYETERRNMIQAKRLQ